jgi:uncharacterized protein YndB with AHSA1/START domain
VQPLSYERIISASRDHAWPAFSTVEGLCSWLCHSARVELGPGGAFDLSWRLDGEHQPSDRTTRGTVLAVDAPRLIRFTCSGAGEAAQRDEDGAAATEVTVELTPRPPQGIRLVLTHAGFGDGPEREQLRALCDRVWRRALEKLERLLTSA